ncbi:hypothetical protein VPH35_057717 [Triticum aestivum]|uniref:Uncharacterized protein n=1 Tax=Aegilops tauschii TaxID=37682 RepID=M8ANP1_AEGTA
MSIFPFDFGQAVVPTDSLAKQCWLILDRSLAISYNTGYLAVQRQFDKRIHIPLPDSQAMQHRFKVKDVLFEPSRKTQDILSPLIPVTDVKKVLAGRGRPLARQTWRYTRSSGDSSARRVDSLQVLSELNKCIKENDS